MAACEEGEAAVLAIFKQGDTNGDGKMDFNEFSTLMMALDTSLNKNDVVAMRDAADADKDGNLDVTEFVHWVFAGASGCKGVAGIKSLVHSALHGEHEEPFNDEEYDMYWNQAQKACGRKPDGFVDVDQVCAFWKRITKGEIDEEEVRGCWADEVFPYASGKEAKEAKAARGLCEEDGELLNKAGFIAMMKELD